MRAGGIHLGCAADNRREATCLTRGSGHNPLMTNATNIETTAYEIIEEGHVFATVTAASAEAALVEAAKTHPRRASDYNLEPGETSTCRWYAWEGGISVSVELPVPGVGADGMSWG